MEPISYYSSSSIADILKKLNTAPNGLSDKEAKLRLAKFGLNVISEKKETGIVLEFLSYFTNPLVLVLLFAASISAFLGEIENFVIISLIVVASVLLDFFEEYSAGNSVEKLKEKVSITATVLRNSQIEEIPSSKICVGDIILLSSGDLVPGDARVIEADDFFVNQSALTGESFPQEKLPQASGKAGDSGAKSGSSETNPQNIVWLGTNVVSGTARAVVFQTGSSSQFGHIAKSLLKKEVKSEFEIGITRFGFFLMKVVLGLVLFIFLGNALVNRNILESFIFAIAIAVGVTPELLPVIMSVTMARSSQKMAKKGVIVKKLSSIPNFGSMNILCTDKTGTLTEGHIHLVTYTDIAGRHNEDVFLYTYLNSFHQTGVKNPLDRAVVEYKKAEIGSYKKTEEIPYDFVRKMMSIAVMGGPEGRILITKGAPEAVINKCSLYQKEKTADPLTPEISKKALAYYTKLSSQGFRVLAVAVKKNLAKKDKYTKDEEANLTLLGFVSFLDPAKKDAAEILKALQKYGIEVKVLTGDNELVTKKICDDVGLKINGILTSVEIDQLTDDALAVRAQNTTIFARTTPDQKNRIILALKKQGAVVGYMGDGINDAPSLKTADVGISVNNAVDVAKETADIILTQKHLKVIVDGVIEGRRSFANTMKYIMMSLSSNFGNMFSVLAAIFYLPFLPMLPIQILLNNFIYDTSQVTIPFDSVDNDWISHPRQWNLSFVKKFMYIFGPISSIFDLLTYFTLYSVFKLDQSAFQTGWFLESLTTQTLVIHVIRTEHLPLLQSRAAALLTLSTLCAVLVGWLIPLTPLGRLFKFTPLPLPVIFVIFILVIAYLILVECVKKLYYRKNKF